MTYNFRQHCKESVLQFSSKIIAIYSLREIFPTDAGQLSDRLKFLAGQEACLLLNYNLFFTRITGHLSDKLKFSAGQKKNLPVWSDSPAVFAKIAFMI